MAFTDFDLDRIRNARLLVQPFESRNQDDDLRTKTLLQPLTHAWQAMTVPLSPAEHLEASRLVPNLPLTDAPAAAGRRGLAALKMYYLSYIAIFARPLAARPHRYDTMLATATAIASRRKPSSTTLMPFSPPPPRRPLTRTR
jgi:hypothetical protein